MPLITNVAARSQTRLGKLTPTSDQSKFVGGFGVVEGNAPPGWHGVGEMKEGIPVSNDHEKFLQWEEHKNAKGETREIKYQGMTLREMRAKREDTDEANRYCGWLSEEKVQREEQALQHQELGQHLSKTTTSGYESVPDLKFGSDNQFAQPYQPPAQRKGWPKGKPRGPRKQPETQPA